MTEKRQFRGWVVKKPEIRQAVEPNVTFLLGENVKGQNRPIWYEVYCYIRIEDIMMYLKKDMPCFIVGDYVEEQVPNKKRKVKKIIIKENDTDTIQFQCGVSGSWNNYDN